MLAQEQYSLGDWGEIEMDAWCQMQGVRGRGDEPWADLTNQRPVTNQRPNHVTSLDQSEASVQVMWSLSTNQKGERGDEQWSDILDTSATSGQMPLITPLPFWLVESDHMTWILASDWSDIWPDAAHREKLIETGFQTLTDDNIFVPGGARLWSHWIYWARSLSLSISATKVWQFIKYFSLYACFWHIREGARLSSSSEQRHQRLD